MLSGDLVEGESVGSEEEGVDDAGGHQGVREALEEAADLSGGREGSRLEDETKANQDQSQKI